jgi:hypothetical protein
MPGSGNSVLVSDLAAEVLSLYGSYVPGETIATADIQSLIFTLNGILDGYGAEYLTVYNSTVLSSFSLSANKGAYTLGSSGTDWTLALIPSILTGVGAIIAPNLENPLQVLTDPEWARIGLKTLTSTIPQAVWIQNTSPTVTFNFWPVPSAAVAVRIYGANQITRVTASTDLLNLPAGFQELLTYDLAIKASPKFGANLPAWLIPAWQQARTRVKESNFEGFISRPDATLGRALVDRGWLINTGGTL